MTSVYYLIVCVNLLYSFEQAEIRSFSQRKEREDKQKVLLNSVTVENQYEYLAKSVTPYCNLSYNEQLEKKQNRCSAIIDNIVKHSEGLKNLMSYKLLPIVPSPVTNNYRNSDIFAIRRGVDGNPKTVGCILGKVTLGETFSIHPTKIVTIKEIHKRVAQVYEDFIRLSPLAANIGLHSSGHWDRLIVKSNEAGDVMASVTVQPKGYSYKLIEEQQQEMKEYFFKHLPNISLFHQVCRYTHELSPFILLYGNRYFVETLNGFKFKISPESIFPNNKFGVEVVYDTIIKAAKLHSNTTILDICSGTGTNSIVVSKCVKEAIGFESVAPAVTEATYFAEFNNIPNVNFILGRVVIKLNAVLRKLNASSDVVAILNHRRSGLGVDIIKTIRRSSQISTLVYMYYKQNSPNTVKNFVDLCSDDNSNVPPFRLTKVVPIDLLPHTVYVEIMLIFQRQPPGNI